MFGEKHIPSFERLNLFSVTLDEYRKCSYPISSLNSTSLFFGILGAAANPIANVGFRNKPPLASMFRKCAFFVLYRMLGLT